MSEESGEVTRRKIEAAAKYQVLDCKVRKATKLIRRLVGMQGVRYKEIAD